MAFDINEYIKSKAGGIGGGLGGLAGLFGVGKGKNPADAANEYINQIPGQTNQYYQPYMDAGNDSVKKLMGMLGQNPTDTYNKLGEGYKQSPGYKFQLEQALSSGNAANAAGGMLGSPQHVQQNEELAQDVASKDYEKYMQNVLGLNSQNMQGLSGLAGLGANASNQYGTMMSNVLGQKGANAYQGQKGLNEGNQSNWANVFGALPWLYM